MLVGVTGGTGFIGRALVERLIAKGHRVRLLARTLPAIGPKPGVEAVTFDPQRGVGADLSSCEAVINLAGSPISRRWTRRSQRDMVDSRIKSTLEVVAAARQAGSVRTMVSASAIGFYGARGDEELDEESVPGNEFQSELCRAWEAAAQGARNGGTRLAIIRIGIVLHPEGGAMHKMMTPFRFGVGGPLGSGRQWMSWIHREDLHSLILHALENDRLEGVFNGTAPEPVRNEEFARALGKAMHRPSSMRAPALAMKLLLGEMATMALDGQRVLPRRTLASGFRFAYPTLDAALTSLL